MHGLEKRQGNELLCRERDRLFGAYRALIFGDAGSDRRREGGGGMS
jgi:hypothetical protein